MTDAPEPVATELGGGDRRLAILLAMAMFVLVVDTSLMNVSIAEVVQDLHHRSAACSRRSCSRRSCPRPSS